jgi:hypothetical protein
MRMPEQEYHENYPHAAQKPKQKCVKPFPVVGKEKTDSEAQDPGDRCEDSTLGAVALAVGKKGIVQKIRSRDKEKNEKIFL